MKILHFEHLDLEENEEADHVDDNEEVAAEGNNSDEEWDAYDELDLVTLISIF